MGMTPSSFISCTKRVIPVGLKDVPSSFNPDSEEELQFAVASFFGELGFDAT